MKFKRYGILAFVTALALLLPSVAACGRRKKTNKNEYEQITLPHDVVENADLMKEGQRVEMMFLTEPEERCLTCELPTYVTLEVTYSEPAVKGNTASTSALKEVTLETGAKIMVPLFIETGEIITVNTTDRSYGQRVK